jgi:hypothetical protein
MIIPSIIRKFDNMTIRTERLGFELQTIVIHENLYQR